MKVAHATTAWEEAPAADNSAAEPQPSALWTDAELCQMLRYSKATLRRRLAVFLAEGIEPPCFGSCIGRRWEAG